MENNGENSGPLSSLPVDRLTTTNCNADRSCQNADNLKNEDFSGVLRKYFPLLGPARPVSPNTAKTIQLALPSTSSYFDMPGRALDGPAGDWNP